MRSDLRRRNFLLAWILRANYTGGSCGWYFQQLLKLYAPLIIPDILENVLILDSDTVFFRKVKMFDAQNRPFYNISKDKKITRTSEGTKITDLEEVTIQ